MNNTKKIKIKTKFRIGDKARIITGKYKNQEVIIEKIEEQRARISGIESGNIIRFHKNGQKKGESYEVLRSIHISNLSFIDPKTGQNCKAAYKKVDDKKIRISRKTGEKL